MKYIKKYFTIHSRGATRNTQRYHYNNNKLLISQDLLNVDLKLL